MKVKMRKLSSVLCAPFLREKRTTCTHIVSLWLLIVISLSSFVRGETTTNENYLQYKEYWLKSEQLCPSIEKNKDVDIDTANFPYKSIFKFMDNLQSLTDLPCLLEAKGPRRKLTTTALIEAIHIDSRQWNYSDSQVCEEHIKIEPTYLKKSVPKIICRIPRLKTKNGNFQTGSLYHPYIWQFQKGKLGLSFSSLNLSYLVPPINVNSEDEEITNTSSHGQHDGDEQGAKNHWIGDEPNNESLYVQIVFTTLFGNICNTRVQQYKLMSDGSGVCSGDFGLCGVYNCSERETLLRSLGFTHRNYHEQLFQIQWRKEPSYLEVLVNTLRSLIMPLFFLSIIVITRRLRLKLASRQQNSSRPLTIGLDRQRQRNVLRQRPYLRTLIRDGRNGSQSVDGSSDINSEHSVLMPSLILNHVVYDIPNGFEDPPPPYDECTMHPPSYLKAISTAKPSTDPEGNALGCDRNNAENESTENVPQGDSSFQGDDESAELISRSSNAEERHNVSQQQTPSQSTSSANSHLRTDFS